MNQAKTIEGILAPVLQSENLTPHVYKGQLQRGLLSLGINTENLQTKGATYTFDFNAVHIKNQVRTEGLERDLMIKDFVEEVCQDQDQQIANSLMESILSKYQKEVPTSSEHLQKFQQLLDSIVENNEITIGNFSENCLTNANTYTHFGQLESIGYVRVPIENKRYTRLDVASKMPHPVHQKKRKRLVKEEAIELKSKQSILQEFGLLSGMMNFEKVSKDQNSYEKVLGLISFQDTSYDDLWQDILDKIDLSKDTEVKEKIYKDKTAVKDDRFRQTVDRIIKEADQYQMDIQDQLGAEKQDQDQLQASVQEQDGPGEQAKKQPTVEPIQVFKSVKINSVVGNQLNRQRYPFAVEDQSDLTNFYDLLPKEKFAIDFPFQLDQFQKRSILHLEKKQSVFVCAHTSAGKTVVAEYGIALAIKHKRKVIYTSPIKALSNQKFREFSLKFDSVGIVTGDISLNQDANCVIMTTEILAKQLYKGADMIRDIEWVIFDEVHYINNAERGVIWEQTIIMLPEHIGIIMLSATVPNYMEFANWVGRTKRRTLFVMKTFHRPVPLEHSMYIFQKFHVIKEANGRFLTDEYKDMLKQIHSFKLTHEEIKVQKKAEKKLKIEERGFYNDNRRQQALKMATQKANTKFIKNVSKGDMGKHKDRQDSDMMTQLIDDCQAKNLLPCVVFCFSKRKIQQLAETIYTNKLNSNQESGQVLHFFNQALQNLKPEDKQLNQFRFLYEIAKNGYAIHHGDLMPLAKEIVELLFSRGLIKVLLATETFAMGINMPTKTVIFHSTKKVDGPNGQLRFLNSSQYVQMSGRAGRRGLDEKGTVIIMVKDPDSLPRPDQMVKMTDNPGEPLISKFRVTYRTILNLYSSREINAQQMMRQSFYQNPKFSSLTSNHQRIRCLKKQYDLLSHFECPYNQLETRLLIEEYMTCSDNNRELNQIQFSDIDVNKLGLPRFALVLDHANQFSKCILLKIQKDRPDRNILILIVQEIDIEFYISKEEMELGDLKKRKIVLEYENSKGEKNETGTIPGTNNKFHYYVRWIKPTELVDIYSEKVSNQKNIVPSKSVYEDLGRKLMAIPDKLTSLVRESEYSQDKQKELKIMTESKCHQCEWKVKHTYQNKKRREVKKQLLNLMSKVDRNELALLGNYNDMTRLLEDLQFVNKDNVLLKGKMAREVDIYIVQVVVQGVFQPLSQQEIAALLSAFVNDFKPRLTQKQKQKQEKQQGTMSPFHPSDTYTPALSEAIDRTYQIISKMVDIEFKYNEFIDSSKEERILGIVNFYLVGPVYDWTLGHDFVDIADPKTAPEGALVKSILRLDILLRNLKSSCMLVGNTILADKVSRASELIKRDIVFTQSLYLVD